jgi:hypothetical protein
MMHTGFSTYMLPPTTVSPTTEWWSGNAVFLAAPWPTGHVGTVHFSVRDSRCSRAQFVFIRVSALPVYGPANTYRDTCTWPAQNKDTCTCPRALVVGPFYCSRSDGRKLHFRPLPTMASLCRRWRAAFFSSAVESIGMPNPRYDLLNCAYLSVD